MSADGNKRKILIPGLVRQIWVTYPDKNWPSGKLGERKKLFAHVLSKVMEVVSMPHGCPGLGLHKCGTSRKTTLGPLPPRRPGWRKTRWTLQEFFLPNVSCSLSIPPSHSLFLFLPVSHLLVNEMCSIDFGLWYHLHLNLSRDITYNWIITLMQQFSNLGHVFLHSICPSVCDTIIFS